MGTRSVWRRVFALVVFAAGAWSLAAAEDVEKKFRVGLAVGGFNNIDEIESDAGNVLTLVDDQQNFEDVFVDPRDDSSVFGKLDIQAGSIATVYGQYAVNKIFIVEASVGYQKTDVGDVEVQAQFDRVDISDLERFNFQTYRIPVGEMERVPIQLTALARFRPRATFNPYLGAGIGYTVVGFEPDDEFDQLSVNLDNSRGGQMRLTSALFGSPALVSPPREQITDLTGAEVDARDTFEWHVAGGAELTFKRKWVAFLDLRWTFGSRAMEIRFNGDDYLGVPVPQVTDYVNSVVGQTTYGAVRITEGGLIDGGSVQLRPVQGSPPGVNCETDPDDCELYFDLTQPDGVPDPGRYYVQGGAVDYGGVSLQIGVRYTF